MQLEEINIIEKFENEGELIKVVEEIGDKITFKGYQEEQVMALINALLKLDFLSMKYETREEVLSILCDSVSNYKISSKINWDSISKVADRLEDDLKEYVDEFLHN
ncbi:MAG: hypothetical protein LIP16_03710 [Clostridium sp.]|nr:hypothetical protein [Clostridium sp.]